jgi:7-carboxy-7-deazaguanine synthase
MDMAEVITRIDAYHCRLVEVTGGEPLLQAATPGLIHALLEKGHHVLLETNGTQDVSVLDPRCIKIMDIKGPSSGEMEKNDFRNLERLAEKDEIKFIIGDRTDYEFATDLLKGAGKKNSTKNIIHFSPLFGKMPYQTLADWILEDRLPVRLHLQLHKIIWPFETRGV